MDPEPNLPLPVEILDHIFSFLQNDIPSLTACISASSCFKAIAQKHLWHHYTLHNCHDLYPQKRQSGTPAQLFKVLVDEPRLVAYIRSLEITIASPNILQWLMTRSLNDEEMAPVLPMLQHLERVSMAGGWTSWDKLHQVFQAALVRTLCLPSVKEVMIEGVDRFPLSLFDRCTMLRKLTLARGNFALELDHDLKSLQTGGTRPSLDSLTIRDTYLALHTIVDWLCNIESSPDIRNLRILHITVDFVPQLSCAAKLLWACSSSLRELELTPGQGINLQYDVHTGHGVIPLEYPTPPPLSLSNMHSLRSLTISGEISTSDNFWVSSDGEETLERKTYSTPLSWICHLLETLPPTLPHLTLDMLFKVVYPSNLKWIRWEELARALAAPHLVGLRRVELLVSCKTTRNTARVVDCALGIFRNDEYLSELIRTGVLVVQSRTKKDKVFVRL